MSVKVVWLFVLTALLGAGFVIVKPFWEEARFNARRRYWSDGLQVILKSSFSPAQAIWYLEEMGGKAKLSPADPSTGRFKVDLHDWKKFDFELKGYSSLSVQVVYDASGKPIGGQVSRSIIPRSQ